MSESEENKDEEDEHEVYEFVAAGENSCERCAAPSCACGCQDQARNRRTGCQCGEACACGAGCTCPD